MKKINLLIMPLMTISLLFSCGESKQHFVTFESNGGSHIDTIRVKNNESINPPKAPTRGEDEFLGWFIDNETFKNKYDFSTKIKSDITLYANWYVKPKPTVSYAIALYNDEGTEPYATIEDIEEGSLVDKSKLPTNPTKTGFTFIGWCTDEAGTKLFDFDTVKIYQNYNLYAGWKGNESLSMLVSAKKDETVSFDCDESSEFIINWGDGTINSEKSHKYSADLYYTIQVCGQLKSFVYTSQNRSNINALKIHNALNIGESAFSSCDKLKSIVINNLTSIGSKAFSNCNALTSINIPNTVTSIGNGAFSGCTSLTSINIPESITVINNSVFKQCSALTSITLPNSISSIGNEAFSGCKVLTSITIPSKVTSIGEGAFSNCKALTAINIPTGVKAISDKLFQQCDKLASITLPNSIESIGAFAFSNCTSIASINIPSKVTSIGEGAFYNCKALTAINISNKVTSIGADAFNACVNLENLSFEENSSLKTIGDHSFYDCRKLTSITIPNSVTYIGIVAFQRISDLVLNVDLTAFKTQESIPICKPGAFTYANDKTKLRVANQVMCNAFIEKAKESEEDFGGWATEEKYYIIG